MDVALNQLSCECSSTEYKNAIKLLFVYIKNIHHNPSMEKYRRIRIGNEKFRSNVWRHETCRTLLLLAGFEEVGEFIVLSNNVDVSVLYKLLQEQVDPTPESSSTTKPPQPQGNPTLNLASVNQAGGIFVEDFKADLTLLSYMVEMGYSKHASEKGLIATKNQGVQPAMDWIAQHPECHYVDPKQSAPNTHEGTSAAPQASSDGKPNVTSRLRMANEQKHAYQEKLRLEAIKKAKLEKAEDQMAKKYLVKNLQSERQESKEKFEREKVIRHVETDEQEKINKGNTCAPCDVNICALRIRMHDGKTLMWETAKETSVKSLYSHVTSLMSDTDEEFHVCIPHPHEVLDADDESTLQDKGLYPKATVVVQKLKQNIPEDQGSNVTATSEGSNVTASAEGSNATASSEDSNATASSGEVVNTDVSVIGTEVVATNVETVDVVMGENDEPVGD